MAIYPWQKWANNNKDKKRNGINYAMKKKRWYPMHEQQQKDKNVICHSRRFLEHTHTDINVCHLAEQRLTPKFTLLKIPTELLFNTGVYVQLSKILYFLSTRT